MYNKQAKVIENIENGIYTFSHRGIKIPDSEKPPIVTKEAFPNLFKALDNPERVGTASSFPASRLSHKRPEAQGINP